MSYREEDLDLYQPIIQLASLIMTVAYRPAYNAEVRGEDIPAPISIQVAKFQINEFLREAYLNLGLDVLDVQTAREWEEEAPMLDSVGIDFYEDMVPYVANCAYVDEMQRFRIVEGTPFSCENNWKRMLPPSLN